MDYHSFFVGFGSALFLADCIWLLTVLRTDPVPELPEPDPEPKTETSEKTPCPANEKNLSDPWYTARTD
jgi:hypothetical protein